MVPGVAERLGREPVRGPGAALEIGGGQVVADQLQVKIGQITELANGPPSTPYPRIP